MQSGRWFSVPTYGSDLVRVLSWLALAAGFVVLAFGAGGFWRSDEGSDELDAGKHAFAELAAASNLLAADSEQPPALVIVFDYLCPYCKELAATLESENTGSKASIAIYHLPLSPRSFIGALAARCAAAQGHFATMHAALLADVEWTSHLSPARLAAIARVPSVGEFLACVKASSTAAELTSGIRRARALGIRATPTVITRDTAFSGVASPATIRRLLGSTSTMHSGRGTM